ncbi:MAG: hypothetical protein ACRD3W_09390, partial [Terriglobales bacterium]
MASLTLTKCQHVIDYLMRREIEAIGLDERDHYKFCRLVVSKAEYDWPDPYVAAFYYHYGRHSSKLIPEWEARETFAKSLGPSLADMMKSPMFTASAEIGQLTFRATGRSGTLKHLRTLSVVAPTTGSF